MVNEEGSDRSKLTMKRRRRRKVDPNVDLYHHVFRVFRVVHVNNGRSDTVHCGVGDD
jgi:hypothetical protein